MATPTGTILHMEPIKIEDLPMHPDFADKGYSEASVGERPTLKEFVTAVVLEADAAMDTDSLNWSGPAKAKGSPPSVAKVETGKKVISVDEMRGLKWTESVIPSRRKHPLSQKEDWFGRKSVHENARKQGTVSFEELDGGLRENHAPQEAAYTPDLYDTAMAIDYTLHVAETEFDDNISAVEVKVYEMCHKIPPPLRPRMFTVCIVAARLGPKKFVTAQLPVDLTKYSGAMYANGRNLKEGSTAEKKKPVVAGKYVSIERGTDLGETSNWEMITCSDAGGALPLAVQKMAIIGQIVKDVGFFVKWNDKKRAEQGAGA